MRIVMQASLYALLVGALSACGAETKELQRVSNSDGTLDAIIAIRETGATVATPTEIYVETKGSKIQGDAIFRADNVDGLEAAWPENGKLVIRAKTARIFLEPKGSSVDVPGAKRRIAVVLEVNDRR